MEPVYATNADGRAWVKRGDIPGYFGEVFYFAMYQWAMWKRFGLPHGRGWMGESEGVLQVITVVDEEQALWERREQEKRMAERGNSGRVKSRRSR